MLYGREATLPLSVTNDEHTLKPIQGPHKYLSDLKNHFSLLRDIASDRQKVAQEKQKKLYDTRKLLESKKGLLCWGSCTTTQSASQKIR